MQRGSSDAVVLAGAVVPANAVVLADAVVPTNTERLWQRIEAQPVTVSTKACWAGLRAILDICCISVGMVAEKSIVCLLFFEGRARSSFSTAALKPMSSS